MLLCGCMHLSSTRKHACSVSLQTSHTCRCVPSLHQVSFVRAVDHTYMTTQTCALVSMDPNSKSTAARLDDAVRKSTETCYGLQLLLVLCCDPSKLMSRGQSRLCLVSLACIRL